VFRAGASRYPGLPERDPGDIQAHPAGFDYERRDVMIAMRDGVKLHTVILVPKGGKGAPMLLTRTPYDANQLTTRRDSAHLASALDGYDNAVETIVEGGYIRVVQDIRGKYGSEGDYVMNRPLAARRIPRRRPRHRHLGHDRLAREERARVERQGRHPRHLVRRLPAADGAREPAPGAQGLGADEPDGGRLDGRRLVPQRRLPAAGALLHLRAAGDARERPRSGGRATTTSTTCFSRRGSRRARARPRDRAARLLDASSLEHPSYDAFWRDQAVDTILRRSRSRCP
jgi:predicted acyl esterase